MLVRTYWDEMTLSELRTTELLLLTTLRLFVESAHSPTPRDWCEGLAAANVPQEGMDGLAMLFRIIAAAPRRQLAVACIHCPYVCPDEGLFLQLIASLQQRNFKDAGEILLNWVAPAAARHAIPYVQLLADGLAEQGYLMPRRSGMPGHFAEVSAYSSHSYLH